MLDSKAVGAIAKTETGKFQVCVRTNYMENLNLWAWHRLGKQHTTEIQAVMYFKKSYPLGELIPFEDLATP